MDVIDTSNDMQAVLKKGKPAMMSKRNSALYYDRMSKLYSEIRNFVFTTEKLSDDADNTLRRSLFMLEGLAAT